jgi:hypothetical protein
LQGEICSGPAENISTAAHERAKSALGKSVVGALNPLRLSQRAVEAVKLDELDEDTRDAIIAAQQNVLAMEAAVKPILNAQITQIWNTEMARRGISADVAQKVIEAMPVMTQFQKLLRATAAK